MQRVEWRTIPQIASTDDFLPSSSFFDRRSRDTTLVVTDDRTHKVTSAYMHISCAYRRSGCPFILKLTKAKEGGWIIKSSRATDVDPKQRSMYRCRHPIGAIPDSQMPPPVPTVVDKNGVSGPKGKGVKGPKRKDGTSSATKGPAKKKKLSDDYEEGITVTPRIAPLSREPRPSAKARAARENSMMDEDEDYYDEPKITPYTLANPDRALAPPFERSQSLLNQISPALVPGSTEQSPYYPYADAAAFNSRSPQLHASSSRYGPTGAPVLPSFPDTLPHWTAFIALLDPALLELAPVLASPAVACSPDQFFAEDEDMRMDLIDGLPGNSIGVWPRLKFKKAIKDRGIEVWKVLEERKSGDLSDSVGTPSFYGPSGAKHGADGKRAHVISARPSWLPVLAGSTTPGGTPIVVTNPAIDPLARISTSSGTSSPASGQPTTSSSLNKVIIGGTSGGKNGAAKAKKVVKVKKENPLPPRTKLQRKAVLANSGYDYDEEDSESSHSDSSSGEEEQDLSAHEEDGDDDSREPEDRKAVSRPSTIAGTVASKKAANIGSNIVVLPAVSSHPLRTVSPVIPSPSPSSSSMQPLSSASRRGPPDLIVAPAPFATSSSMVLDATRPPFVPSLPFATTPTPATVAGSPSVMRIPYIPVWKPNSS
jgi:hypothetical protein